MDSESTSLLASTSTSTNDDGTEKTSDAEFAIRMKNLRRILLEGLDVDLTLSFLFKHCKADINILKQMKTLTESGRSSILHNAIVVSHAYMYNGTTWDVFLRENLDWLGKATNWAKFTAVAR